MTHKTRRIGWTLHHKKYYSGELTYRNFDKTKDEFMWKGKESKVKGIEMRALYRLESFRQVRKRHGQFLLTCSPHHHAIESIDKFAPPKVKKLIRAWKMTKTKWKYK